MPALSWRGIQAGGGKKLGTVMVKYFAYGSNMNPKRLINRQISFAQRKRAVLKGYRLEFNKVASRNPKEGYANIIQDENGVVEGALYEILESDLSKLNRYEGFPAHYDRIKVKVHNDFDQIDEAVVYIAQPDKTISGLKPSRDYLDHLLAAKDILSENYYNRLKARETLD